MSKKQKRKVLKVNRDLLFDNLNRFGQFHRGTENTYTIKLNNEVVVTKNNVINMFLKGPIYIFGYGSLLYSRGWCGRFRRRKVHKDELIECNLNGYSRGPWGIFNDMNFYGIIENSRGRVNGTLLRIDNPTDWLSLMSTEVIYGLFSNYNYRVVDVTNKITKTKGDKLKGKVHAVVNELSNVRTCLHTFPNWRYYSSVYKGIKAERSDEFAEEFIKLGGFRDTMEVYDYIGYYKKANKT